MENPDLEKTVQAMTYCVKRDCSHCPELNNSIEKEEDCRVVLMEDALALLKAQEPQPPKHIHEEYPEHDWERKKDGSIDEFSEENGYHNGPRCKRCGESFCIHCEPDGYEKRKQCVVDKTYCPKCGVKLFPVWGRTKITYCNLCGQGLKWK